MVVHPDDPDRHEADHVADVSRPQTQELVARLCSPRSGTSTVRMSSVAAIAKTPSAKVSSLAVVIVYSSASSPTVSPGGRLVQALEREQHAGDVGLA